MTSTRAARHCPVGSSFEVRRGPAPGGETSIARLAPACKSPRMPDFSLEMTGAPLFPQKIFLRNAPSRFWDGPRRLIPLPVFGSSLNNIFIFFCAASAIAVLFLAYPSRVTWNARPALNRFASRLAQPLDLDLSVRCCDRCLALVVLTAKSLNISFIEEGAPIGYLHDVVHLGAWCRAATPLAGGVRLEGPGTQGGPGGPVGGVGLEPPGMCRGGPVRVGGAPRRPRGGQARAPREGASRGRHGRRHGSSVPDPARDPQA